MHRDAEAEGAERGGSLRRHHLGALVRRPHLQSVLREVCACQEQAQEAEVEPDRGRRGRHDGRHRAESAQDKRLSVRAFELRTARAQQRADRRPYPSALQVLVDPIDLHRRSATGATPRRTRTTRTTTWSTTSTAGSTSRRTPRACSDSTASGCRLPPPLRPRTSATPWRRTRRGSRRRRRTMSEWCPAVLFTGPRRRQM